MLDGANFDADTFNADTWKDGVSFRQYDDYPAISTALSAGEVQGFCVDKSILAIYKTEGRSYIDAEFSPQEYGVATKKGSDFSTLCDDLVKAGWQMAPSSSSSKTTVWIKPRFSEPRECRERGVCHVWLVFVRVLVHRLDAS